MLIGAAVLVLTAAAAGPVLAQEASYQPVAQFRSPDNYLQVQEAVVHTDNAQLTSNARVSDTLSLTGFAIDYTESGSRLDLDARGTLDWVEYLDHTFPGAPVGGLNASAIWGHSADLFQLIARDTFGQVVADPLSSPTPTNLEQVNYLTVGPQINFNLDTTSRLTLYGLFSNVTYQRSPYDSNSFEGGAALVHDLSTASELGLHVDEQHTSFESQSAAADFSIRSAYLSYAAQLNRTRASVDAGYSQLEQGATKTGGPLLKLELDRVVAPSVTVYLRAQTEFSTAADALRTETPSPLLLGAIAATASPEPYQDHSLGLGTSFNYARTKLSLLGTVDRVGYRQNTTFDVRNTNLVATLQRSLSPTVSAGLNVERTYQHFLNIAADLAETTVDASVTKKLRRLGLTAYFQRRHHTASGSQTSLVTNFDESRVGVNVTYDVIGRH